MRRKKGIVTRFFESDFMLGFGLGITVLLNVLVGFGYI